MSATIERATIVAIMRLAWPRHAAKRAAIAAGAPVATAKAWVAGRRTPSAETLLEMAARDDALAEKLMEELHARRAARGAGRAAAPAGSVAAAHGEVG